MDFALLILIVLLAIALAAAFWKGRWQLILAGLKQAWNTIRTMWLRIILGMALGGFIQVVIPSASIAHWLGPASGIKGILIGSYIGLFVSGGPYVIMPVIASIYAAGAGPGPTLALMTGGLLGIQGLFTFYIPILGLRLSIANYIVALFVPPLVGLTGGLVFHLLGFG
jgi:uncharacterized membrane protein YraQ (UPF0718 family)